MKHNECTTLVRINIYGVYNMSCWGDHSWEGRVFEEIGVSLEGMVRRLGGRVGALLGERVLGLALISDLGLVTAIGVDGVGDPLEAAVGQGHVIGAGGLVAVALLVVAVVVLGVVVVDRPVEVVGGRPVGGFLVGGGRGGGGVSGPGVVGEGHGHKGEQSNEDLKSIALHCITIGFFLSLKSL